MQFSRHARGRLRLYDISVEDAERIASTGVLRDTDGRGNLRRVGGISDGRHICVVVALDQPDTIITVYVRSR